MDTDNKKKLIDVIRYYAVVKEVILWNEQIDPTNKSDLQVVNELRHSFDHLMRVLASEFEVDKDKDNLYINLNLQKTIGHVTRAGYDTLDWLSLNLKEQIGIEIKGFSLATIKAVYPDYWKDKEALNKLQIDISEARAKKDVSDLDFHNFVDYTLRVKEVHKLWSKILSKKTNLIEYESKLKNEKVKKYIGKIALVLMGALIGFVLGKI